MRSILQSREEKASRTTPLLISAFSSSSWDSSSSSWDSSSSLSSLSSTGADSSSSFYSYSPTPPSAHKKRALQVHDLRVLQQRAETHRIVHEALKNLDVEKQRRKEAVRGIMTLLSSHAAAPTIQTSGLVNERSQVATFACSPSQLPAAAQPWQFEGITGTNQVGGNSQPFLTTVSHSVVVQAPVNLLAPTQTVVINGGGAVNLEANVRNVLEQKLTRARYNLQML